MKKKVVITSGARTPVGAFLGGLKTVPVQDLAAAAIKEALKRSGNLDPALVEDVIMGHVESSGECPNLGRNAAMLAGLEFIPGYTVNRICGSSMQSIANGAVEIMNGDAEIIVAGGAESLSRAPYYLPLEARYDGLKMGNQMLKDANTTYHHNAQPYPMYPVVHMGNTAENIVRKYSIPREDADRFAFDSQMKAKAAKERKRFEREIVPVEVPGRKGAVTIVDQDEHMKPDTTMEGLAKLKPAFEKDGIITAGNASGLNDCGAAVVLMSEDKAAALGLDVMAEVVDYAVAGLDPMLMGLGPVYSIQKLLKKNNMTMEDIDVFEINEAFGGQMLGCMIELGMTFESPLYERLNPNGGAIALGHPLGATGARLVISAMYELIDKNKRYAIASACIGGGMGIAVLIKNPKA
ncbi:thiolase family protein [Acidaminobacter sp.]|uniref:thiolase family protein n=1 Tax=Acidaminobacter sp. TaxID=1872102 RepID=UPI002563C21B|nr:thiolase family protein [Acidaminobacter sp.]MDK9711140.1 thiolase family protein [Acidaminobacter sp.]